MSKSNTKFYWLAGIVLLLLMRGVDAILRINYFHTLTNFQYELITQSLLIAVGSFAAWILWKHGDKSLFKMQWKGAYIGYGFLFFILLIVWNIFTFLCFPQTNNQATVVETTATYNVAQYSLDILAAILIGPIVEEFVFRGVTMTALSKFRTYHLDLFLSSVLFSLHHLLGYGWVTTDFITYFGAGLLFALYFKKTNYCIYYPLLLHAVWNALPFLLHLLKG